MKRFLNSIFLLGGLILSLAAFFVVGQEKTADVVIDKKPLQDFAAYVEEKRLDWTKSFLVEAETGLTKDGKFDREKTKFTKTEGDADLVEAVKKAFQSVGDSGWLGYLSMQGLKDFKLSAAQNSENFSALIVFEQPTPERARTLSSGLNGIVTAALGADKNGLTKLGDDEKKLLNGTKVTSEGKTVTINVSLTAGDFQEMVRRRLSEAKEEKTAK
jgi:hypothetical protein